MQSATVVQAGLASNPESGRDCLRLIVDAAYSAWQSETALWVEPTAPQPASGDAVQWDHRRALIAGQWWRKVELDGAA